MARTSASGEALSVYATNRSGKALHRRSGRERLLSLYSPAGAKGASAGSQDFDGTGFLELLRERTNFHLIPPPRSQLVAPTGNRLLVKAGASGSGETLEEL